MEKNDTTSIANTKDSAYTNSYSNSASQRSGSLKDRKYGSNLSGSSGYGGGQPTTSVDCEANEIQKEANQKRVNKKKDRKKRRKESPGQSITSPVVQIETITDTVDNGENILSPTLGEKGNTKKTQCLYRGQEETVANDEVKQETASTSLVPSYISIPSHTTPSEDMNLESGFCCTISPHDSIVLYMTPNSNDVLGYSRDIWLGRSFLDFVHPKDRYELLMAASLSKSAALPAMEPLSPIYAMMRKSEAAGQYHPKVIEKCTVYKPYELALSFRKLPNTLAFNHLPMDMILVLQATPISSLYKVPNEMLGNRSPKFSTRQTAAGIIIHVDDPCVAALGYFPRNIIGRCVMDFYHPNDMLYLKAVYDTVVTNARTSGAPFLSKPYRFLVQNGCYISLETEWKSCINPWSHQLEFESAHRVLQGPNKCNVFAPSEIKGRSLPNDHDKYKEELLNLLESSLSMPAKIIAKDLAIKCKNLGSYMDLILSDTNKKELKLDLPNDPSLTPIAPNLLGKISPHDDCCEGKSSSDTPQTYMQLNYNDKLSRYFNSHPLESEMTEEPNIVWERDTVTSTRDCCEPSEDKNSSDNMSSVSNLFPGSLTNTTSNTETATSSGSRQLHQPYAITEAMINTHNENMEKCLLKQHGVARRSDRDGEKSKKGIDEDGDTQVHGIKRSGSHSWKNDPHTSPKHLHLSDLKQNIVSEPENNTAMVTIQNKTQFNQQLTPHNYIVHWPSVPVGVQNANSTHITPETQYGAPNGLSSLCYIPVSQPNTDQQQRLTHSSMYTPSLFGQHMLYLQPCIVYRSMVPSVAINAPNSEITKQQESTKQNETDINLLVPSTSKWLSKHNSSLENESITVSQKSIKKELAEKVSSNGNKTAMVMTKSKLCDDSNPSMTKQSAEKNKTACGSVIPNVYSSQSKTCMSTHCDNQLQSKSDIMLSKKKNSTRLSPAFWLDQVTVTPELIYKYQINRNIDVLKDDVDLLKDMHQPIWINEQLKQLYIELESDGLPARIPIGEAIDCCSHEDNDCVERIPENHNEHFMMCDEDNSASQISRH